MRIRPILYEKEEKLKKLLSNRVNVFLGCNDAKRQAGSLLLIQTSRKANIILFSFLTMYLMFAFCELRKSKTDKASCSILNNESNNQHIVDKTEQEDFDTE